MLNKRSDRMEMVTVGGWSELIDIMNNEATDF